jgi:hypothetical protein
MAKRKFSTPFLAMTALAAALTVAPRVTRAAEDVHPTPIPQSDWANLPQQIPMDTTLEECAGKGGAVTGDQRHRLCTIPTAQCERRPGWKVVERDAYRMGSQRLAACRWMGG